MRNKVLEIQVLHYKAESLFENKHAVNAKRITPGSASWKIRCMTLYMNISSVQNLETNLTTGCPSKVVIVQTKNVCPDISSGQLVHTISSAVTGTDNMVPWLYPMLEPIQYWVLPRLHWQLRTFLTILEPFCMYCKCPSSVVFHSVPVGSVPFQSFPCKQSTKFLSLATEIVAYNVTTGKPQ